MISAQDTIIAIATAPANGAIGILRLSGPDSLGLLSRVFVGHQGVAQTEFASQQLHHGYLRTPDHAILDEVMVVFMPAPHSFTGEDVVEIHAHGGIFHLRCLLQELMNAVPDLHLRIAGPGEFSLRAYINGKMDLTQAEAIHGLITAESDLTRRGHLANLGGHLRKTIAELRENLIHCLAMLEASFEFPEEGIETYSLASIHSSVWRIESVLHELLAAYQTSRLADSVVKVAIVGLPNVGKSSLLNAVLCEDRAIVSSLPGTTRDAIDGIRHIDGIRFNFIDTAGIRETAEEIEALGVARSRATMESADIILWITDDPLQDVHVNVNSLFDIHHIENKLIYVLNKYDLYTDSHALDILQKTFHAVISSRTHFGIAPLLQLISQKYSVRYSVQNYVHINDRQKSILDKSILYIKRIKSFLTVNPIPEELLAQEMRGLAAVLSDISGSVSSDDVLGEVFSRFCIGK